MAAIYLQAFVTIAAIRSSDIHGGLFGPEPLWHKFGPTLDPYAVDEKQIRQVVLIRLRPDNGFEVSPLLSRG